MPLEVTTLNPLIAEYLRDNLSIHCKPMPDEPFLVSGQADGVSMTICPGIFIELKLGDEVISVSEHRI